jgi:hypothetical protein
MNSRQYERMMIEVLNTTLAAAGIDPEDCAGSCLSADRTEYEIVLKDGTSKTIPSRFDRFED